jgi:ribosomal protein S4E
VRQIYREPNGFPEPKKCDRLFLFIMTTHSGNKLQDGAQCKVVAGSHSGKSGIVRDINTSKTGHITITVVQANGVRFKTLAKNVEIE